MTAQLSFGGDGDYIGKSPAPVNPEFPARFGVPCHCHAARAQVPLEERSKLLLNRCKNSILIQSMPDRG